MKRTEAQRTRILYLSQAGLIAALYTVLTLIVSALGLASGVIQIRLSEALCILPIFLPAAIPGLTIGCLISNLITGCIWQDILFGTLATLIGAIGARALRKLPFLVPLPTVVANTLIVPFVLAYAYGFEGGVLYFMATVGVGEILSAYLAGMVFYYALKPYAARMFKVPTGKNF